MKTSVLLIVLAVIAQPAETALPSLKMRLEQYFHTSKEADRAKLLEIISKSHQADEVASELGRLELWSKPDVGRVWTVNLPSGQVVRADVRLPADYDASKTMPLILAFSAADESSENVLPRLIEGPKLQQAWVVMDKPVGGSFYQPVSAAGDLPALLRELRRKLRVDVDRTYIFGENGGADAAWVAAIMYPRPFAALIAFSGYPRVPYAEQVYPFLLMNLRSTPFLAAWAESPRGTPPSTVQSVNEAIAHFAIAAGLRFDTATLATKDPGVRPNPLRIIEAILAQPRKPTTQAELWFRYLPQGDAGWIRASDLGGIVWEDEQISISASADADRDAFIADTIKQKLFHLAARIEGQTITIDTKRIAAVELRLSPEQVDLTQPAAVIINGRERFDGPLDPSVKDVLETAYETWDFQHPVYVRKSFTINVN